MRHLTDSEIQTYVDASTARSHGAFGQLRVEKHVKDCSLCRQTLRDYESLYVSIEACPSPKLSTDFTNRVMMRIEAETDTQENRQSLLLAVVSPLVVMVALILSLNLPSLVSKTFFHGIDQYHFWKAIAGIYSETLLQPGQITPDWTVLDQFTKALTSNPAHLALILLVVGILAAFGSLERLAARAEYRRI